VNTASAKELFILGRISLRPTHGHEIMRTLRESHADQWVELSEKHVYYILRKLDRDGLVAATEERIGNLPARKVYAITDSGRTALAEMMAADNLVHTLAYSDFDVVLGMLCYTDALDDAAKSHVLDRREAELERRLSELVSEGSASVLVAETSGFPRLILAKIERTVRAELEWVRTIQAEVARAGWAAMRPTFTNPATKENS